jgi:hypothetical protein
MYALPAVDTYLLKSTVVRRVWLWNAAESHRPNFTVVPEEQEHGQSLARTGSPRARWHSRRALRIRGNCGLFLHDFDMLNFLLRSEPRSLDEGIPIIFILRIGTTWAHLELAAQRCGGSGDSCGGDARFYPLRWLILLRRCDHEIRKEVKQI